MSDMGPEETERYILELLRHHGPLTTREITEINRERGNTCPDGAARTLARLRHRGKVQGELSREAKGWVWSVPDGDRGPGS